MVKEKINSNQFIFLIALFVTGSSVILGVYKDAEQDAWLSIILAFILSLPLVLMYARILKLNPGETLFDILEKLFGKIVGKIFIFLMTWYAFHLGTAVVCNFTKFVEVTILPNTPEIIISSGLLLVSLYMIKSSTTTLGKWAVVALFVFALNVLLTVLISISKIDFTNLYPILEHSPKDIIAGSLQIMAFPFAETVLFLGLGCFMDKKDNPYKIYLFGLILGGILLLSIFMRNLTVLGIEMLLNSYFPSYVSVRIVELGTFLNRVEGIITINFILTVITKVTVCVMVAVKGFAKLFNVKHHEDIAMPVVLLALALCSTLYASVIEMFAFMNVYLIYAFPFQVIIPLIVWIASEMKMRKSNISH